MPRKTAKSKSKNCNVTAVSNCVPKRTCTIKIARNGNEIVKPDLMVETAKETVTEVFHRKSERRRIARDIFLVFEEESNSRRKTRGTNKTNAKPKFGHLKVDDHIKPKGLLRDIKNEHKCYINGNSLSVNSSLATDPILKCNTDLVIDSNEGRKTKSEKNKSTACKSMNTSLSSNSIKNLKESQYCTIEKNSIIAARVNPIFLWVKQDDTRIVEVRCEDYDKRNRIRITKTTNGWRAIPRSDPTSTRVLKFYPTPLMKVKKEIISEANRNNNHFEIKNIGCNNYSTQNLLSINVNEIDTKMKEFDSKYNSLPPKIDKIKKKKSKKKKKSHSKKSSKKFDTQTMKIFNSRQIQNTSEKIYNNLRFECKNIEDSMNLEVIEDKPKNVNTFTKDVQSELGTTYQKESFHLCPKTGLFLLNSNISISQYNSENICQNESNRNDEKIVKNCFENTKDVTVDAENYIIEPKIHINDENTESLEAKTRNLKDLLDDDNLLQHCDENANSDAELIDTLVKTSCENNLIQENELLTKVSMDHIPQKADNEMVVQLITHVSDPPKCLSFNEAGEIEGLNGDLFQSNTFNETYDKEIPNISCEQQIALHSTTTIATSAMIQRSSTCDNTESNIGILDNERLINIIDDSPKDLSYKKREEVCPPSESRSQCAVTSSSDVIESSRQENSSLKSTSESLKNLVLEQFIKLNALSSQHQRGPIDLGKQRQTDIANIKSLYGSESVCSNNFIETVVIEDDEDDNGTESEVEEEPLKKRLRINNKSVNRSLSKISIDKDPDPLTQLRLLIKNTQWKVPDPILVPKDRLSAVLASPAREIPLLITTRPELRLPEAFAYPEIIQNPNILVISMAQLETILKNEHENKSTSSKGIENVANLEHRNEENIPMQLSEHLTSLQTQPTRQFHLEHQTKHQTNSLNNSSNKPLRDQLTVGISSREENKKVKSSQTESSLSSDNMSTLNQMFWLPYFGNISQDVIKSLNSPILLHENFSNIIPILNSHLNGLTNLDDIFKNKSFGQSASYNDSQTFKQKLGTSEELSIFQKIVERQMQSVLQLNKLKKNYSRFSDHLETDSSITTLEKGNPKNIKSSHNIVEQKKQNLLFPNNINSSNQSNNCNITFIGEKSYNLRSSVGGRQSSENKQYSNPIQRRNTDNKPRLTCKSLSNLLDPEYGISPSSNTSCRQQFSDKGSTRDYHLNEKIGNEKKIRDTIIVPPSARSCSNTNLAIRSSNDFNKEKPKTLVDSIIKENNTTNSVESGISADTNIPIWHPLFGSNKAAYSSPWQWTTVTATGE
ncbi:uncharacterized protein ACRADG_003309 [Cochliomyia hominivorax]